MATADTSKETTETVSKMISHIANSGAIVKSQQRDEEDIGIEEKCRFLTDIWHRNPTLFLERFHRWLREDDLECFAYLSDQYEVIFFLKEVKKRLDSAKWAVTVRNRRYESLKKLEREGQYFSDNEMKARDPLMFEQLIGQYQTNEDREQVHDQTDLKFSSILTTFIEEQNVKELYGMQKELEDDMMEEEEEDSDEENTEDSDEENTDDANEDVPQTSKPSSKKKHEVKYDEHGYPIYENWIPTPATEAEKTMLKQEFLNHMHQRYLSGEDKDFDYSSVDYNAEYDSLDIRTQDEEEKYFDEEEPEETSVEDGGEEESKVRSDGEMQLEEWETFGNDVEDDKRNNAENETSME